MLILLTSDPNPGQPIGKCSFRLALWWGSVKSVIPQSWATTADSIQSPQMVIRILKIACVTAPKGFLSRLHDNRTSILCLLHNRIDFRLGRNVMSECELRGAWMLSRIPESWETLLRGQIASFNPASKSKKATAPCSNSLPIMPCVGRPRPSW